MAFTNVVTEVVNADDEEAEAGEVKLDVTDDKGVEATAKDTIN